MKTKIFTFFFFFFMICASALVAAKGSSEGAKAPSSITVYAYDSFTADWGPGPELAKRFTAKTGIAVELVSCGDAGQVLSRAALEKKSPRADVLVGIDNNLIDGARKAGVLVPYKPAGAEAVSPALVIAEDWLLTPYDWGQFAMIFDSSSKTAPPRSLAELADPRFAGKIILMDPRTSTPGLGFLAWTMAAFGSDWPSFWERLKGNILTLAPGWDAGYSLFTSGEAPLVVSYTTSPAYHAEFEGTDRYQALIFPEGHVAQIEGLGLAKGAPNPAGGKAFIDFMLTDEAQEVLPLTQFMYPVSETVTLPASFAAAPRSEKTPSVPSAEVAAAVERAVGILSK